MLSPAFISQAALEVLERSLRFAHSFYRDAFAFEMPPVYEPTAIEHCQIQALLGERHRLQNRLDEITGVAERRRKVQFLQWAAMQVAFQPEETYQAVYRQAYQQALDRMMMNAPRAPLIVSKDQLDPDVWDKVNSYPVPILEYRQSPAGPPSILQSIGLDGVFGSGSGL